METVISCEQSLFDSLPCEQSFFDLPRSVGKRKSDFPTDLGRSKRLCSQGKTVNERVNNVIISIMVYIF